MIAAGAPFDDRGLLLGDGLFETLLAKDGALVLIGDHVLRMQAGARALGLPEPDGAELTAAAKASLGSAGLRSGRAAVRLTWTAGPGGRGLDRPAEMQPRLVASASASPQTTAPLRLALATTRRNEASATSRWKTLSYLDNVLARREAHAAGADEAVMLNTAGRLACAAAGNLFWIDSGRLFTPALACGALAGVMRSQVIAAAPGAGLELVEVAAAVDALEKAEGVFVTNSLMGVRAATGLGRGRSPHPAIAALAQGVSDVS